MAQLGSPRTDKFKIGTVELRVGPLDKANKLTQANTVGLIDDATVNVDQDTAELMGGFPQHIVDSAIVSESTTITATAREYSRRNIRMMLGQGVETSPPTDFSTTIKTTATASATSITVDSGSGINDGDLIVVYSQGAIEKVQVLRVKTNSSGTLTLDSGTPLIFDVAKNDPVYVAASVPIGLSGEQHYFSAQVVSMDRPTGRPTGFNFWKATVSGGMEMSLGGTDFSSTDLTINLLMPAANEYGAGSDLEHLANVIPDHPIGMYFGGADDT